jgi:small subunit ribosomal protein S20
MPNKKSAERRMRSSARQQERNLRVKSRLKTLERNLRIAVQKGEKEAAAKVLVLASSALDKAAKTGVIHRATANRKKSRLSLHLASLN